MFAEHNKYHQNALPIAAPLQRRSAVCFGIDQEEVCDDCSFIGAGPDQDHHPRLLT
jgi:hypothetical protein